MTKTEKITQIQVSKATRDMVKELAREDNRLMTGYVEILVEREYKKLKEKEASH